VSYGPELTVSYQVEPEQGEPEQVEPPPRGGSGGAPDSLDDRPDDPDDRDDAVVDAPSTPAVELGGEQDAALTEMSDDELRRRFGRFATVASLVRADLSEPDVDDGADDPRSSGTPEPAAGAV
jgi:hypothetical protein